MGTADIATLGLAIDATQFTKAAGEMDKFADTGKKVESTADRIAASMARVKAQMDATQPKHEAFAKYDEMVRQANAALAQHTQALQQQAQAAKQSASATDAHTEAVKKTGDAAKETAVSIESLERAAAKLAALVGFEEMVKEVALLSARFEELGLIMDRVGSMNGQNAGELREMQHAMQELGFSGVTTRQALVNLMQAGADMNKVQALSKVALDASAVGGKDSAKALEIMTQAMRTGRTETVKAMGLNVSFTGSYREMEHQLGRNKNALTETEKVQARQNELIRAGAGIQGAYTDSLGTVSGQLRDLKVKFDEVKEALGAAFQDSLLAAIRATGELLEFAKTHAEGLGKALLGITVLLGELTALKLIAPALALISPVLGPIAVAVALAVAAFIALRGEVVTLGGVTASVGDRAKATWEEVAFVAKSAWDGIASTAKSRMAELADVFHQTSSEIDGEGMTLPDKFHKYWRDISTFAVEEFANIAGVLAGLPAAADAANTALVDSFHRAFDNISTLAKALGEIISTALSGGGVSLAPIQEAWKKVLANSGPSAAQSMRDSFKAAFNQAHTDAMTAIQLNPLIESQNRVLARMRKMADERAALAAQLDQQPDLPVSGRTPDRAVDTKAKISEYEKLMRAIAAKNVEAQREIDMGRPLREAEKMQIEFLEKVASGEMKATAAQQQRALTELKALDARQEQIKQTKAYLEVMRSLHDLENEQDSVLINGEKRTEMQKKAFDVMEDLRTGRLKLTEAEAAAVANMLEMLLAQEKQIKLYDEAKKAMDTQTDALNKQRDTEVDAVKKQKEHNEEINLTKIQLAQVKQARELHIAAMEDERAADRDLQADNAEFPEQYREQAEALRGLANARRETAALSVVGAVKEQWKDAADKIEGWLSDALMNAFEHGKSFGQSLIDALKTMFKRLVLEPIIRPISQGMSSIFTGTNSQGGGLDGSPVGGGGFNFVQAGMQLWQGFNTGFASIGLSIAKLGALTGSSTMTNFGVGMASPAATGVAGGPGFAAGQVAGAGLGAFGGIALGNAISGNMSIIGDNPTTATAIGAAIGTAIFPGLGGVIGGALAGLANRAFGTGPKQVTGTGVTGSYLTGPGFTGSNTTSYHQEGGWFRSDRDGMDKSPIDPATAKALSQALDMIKTSLNNMLTTIGGGQALIDTFSTNLDITWSNTGDAAKDAQINAENLQKAFGEVSDSLVGSMVPGLAAFQQGNERMTETLARVAGEILSTDAVLAVIGKTAQQAFGTVGLASVTAREQLIAFAGGMDSLQKNTAYFAEHFLSDQEKVRLATESVNKAMNDAGVGWVATKDQFKTLVQSQDLSTEAGRRMYGMLIQLAPAFDQAATMVDQLITAAKQKVEAAQQAVDSTAQAVKSAYAAYNNTMGQIADAYNAIEERKEELHQQRLQEEREAAQAAELKRMQQFTSEMEALAQQAADARSKAAQQLQKAQSDLVRAVQVQDQMIQALIDRAKSALIAAFQAQESAANAALADAKSKLVAAFKAMESAATAAVADAQSKLVAAFKAQQAAAAAALSDAQSKLIAAFKAQEAAANSALADAHSKLVAAYNKESAALQTTIDKFRDFAKTLMEFRQSLLTGDLSPLTPEQQYQQTRSTALSTVSAAKGGDLDAMSRVQKALTDFLEASKLRNASGSQYQTDFAFTQEALKSLSLSATTQADTAQQQLDALHDQVASLTDLGDGVLSVHDAIQALSEAQQQVEVVATLRDQVALLVDLGDKTVSVHDAIQALQEAQQTVEVVATLHDQVAKLVDLGDGVVSVDTAIQALTAAQRQAEIVDNLREEIGHMVDLGDGVLSVHDAVQALTEAQRQVEMVDTLREQVGQLVDLGDKTISVEAAIADLRAAQRQQEIWDAQREQIGQMVDLGGKVLSVDDAIAALQEAEGQDAWAQRNLDYANSQVEMAKAAEVAYQEGVARDNQDRAHMQQDVALAEFIAGQMQNIAALQITAEQQQSAIYDAERAHNDALFNLDKANEDLRQLELLNALGRIANAVEQQTQATQQAASAAAAQAAAQQQWAAPAGSGYGTETYDADHWGPQATQPFNMAMGYAGGLDRVPYDNFPARLHKGERVLTAAETHVMDGLGIDLSSFGKGAGNRALAAGLKALQQEVAQLRAENAQQAAMLADSMYASSDRAADKVASSNIEAASQASHYVRSKPDYS